MAQSRQYSLIAQTWVIPFAATLCAITMAIGTSAAESQLERLPELDRRVLEARQAITSCELEIVMRVEAPTRANDKLVENDLYYLIAGRKVLFKRFYPSSSPPTRMTWCRNCEADGYVLHFMDQGKDNIQSTSFQSLGKLAVGAGENMIPDPRLIGLTIEGFASSVTDPPIDSVVGGRDRKELAAVREDLDGQECVHVSYRYRDDARVAYWIAPGLGHSVVRMEFRTDKGALLRTITRPKRCEPSGVWFPESVVFTEHRDGQLVDRKTYDISIKSMNETIDSARFAIPALGLPSGTRVYAIPPRGEAKRWNGTELVSLEDERYSSPSPTPVNRFKKWFVRGAVALAAAALIVGLQLLWKRRRARTA